MTSCDNCIHYDICIFHIKGDENKKCLQFKNKIDVVEVIRCENCKRSRPTIFNEFYYCKRVRAIRKENDFCSKGILKEGIRE